MLDKCTPGDWNYVGDHVVGVVGDCGCPAEEPEVPEGQTICYPDRPHESHDIVKPLFESELPEGVTMEEHIANCHLMGAAKKLYKALSDILYWDQDNVIPNELAVAGSAALAQAVGGDKDDAGWEGGELGEAPDLPESAPCPHNDEGYQCGACLIAGDLAYDAARERRSR